MKTRQQQGAVLVVSLIILILITLVGVAAIQGTIVEEKTMKNSQSNQKAFNAAEVALAEAEDWLDQQTSKPEPTTGCSQPCVWPQDSTFFPEDQTSSWWATNGADATSSIADVNDQPQYVIEFMRFVPDTIQSGTTTSDGTYYYRITARAVGEDVNAITMIQVTYTKRY